MLLLREEHNVSNSGLTDLRPTGPVEPARCWY